VAETELWLGAEGALPYVASVERARRNLGRALALTDSLAEAHSALAGLYIGDDQFADAEREARRAIEQNPSLADPYRWLAQLRAGEGKIGETVRLLETARELDPVDINVLTFLGRAYFYAGREADALAHWDRTKPLAPFRVNAHLAEYFLGRREFDRAEESLREMKRVRPDSIWVDTFGGMLAGFRGDMGSARAVVERLRARSRSGQLTDMFLGFVHYAMGQEDAFLACEEKAFELHSLPLMELLYSPLFAAARADPRVQDLLRRQAALRTPSEPDAAAPNSPAPQPRASARFLRRVESHP
jgi:hypothetical protein